MAAYSVAAGPTTLYADSKRKTAASPIPRCVTVPSGHQRNSIAYFVSSLPIDEIGKHKVGNAFPPAVQFSICVALSRESECRCSVRRALLRWLSLYVSTFINRPNAIDQSHRTTAGFTPQLWRTSSMRTRVVPQAPSRAIAPPAGSLGSPLPNSRFLFRIQSVMEVCTLSGLDYWSQWAGQSCC